MKRLVMPTETVVIIIETKSLNKLASIILSNTKKGIIAETSATIKHLPCTLAKYFIIEKIK